MALNGLLDVQLAVTDPDELVTFWVRHGMIDAGNGIIGTTDRPVQLRVVEGRYRHLRDLHLGCDHGDDLLAIRGRLEALGVGVECADDQLRCREPVLGHTVTIDVRPGSTLPASPERRENAPGRAIRIDARVPVVTTASQSIPRRLGHVVFGTPDPRAAASFYVDGLGFKISDQIMNGAAMFLRCSPDHHTVLVQPSRVPYLNHYALEMDDVDAVGRAGALMVADRPESSVIGPGRHVIGSNVFWYLFDPAGNMFELYADMDQIVDDARWDRECRRDDWDAAFAVWGGDPPKRFFSPPDLPAIAAGREADGYS